MDDRAKNMRMSLWCDVWVGLAKSFNVRDKDTPTAWADKAVKDFDDRFSENLETNKCLTCQAEIERLRGLLKKALNYVSEAFNEEYAKPKTDNHFRRLGLIESDMDEIEEALKGDKNGNAR